MEYDHEVMMYYQRRYMQTTVLLGVMLMSILAFLSVALGHFEVSMVFGFTAAMLLTQTLAEDTDGYCRAFWSKVVEPKWRPMDEWEEDLVDRGKIPE